MFGTVNKKKKGVCAIFAKYLAVWGLYTVKVMFTFLPKQ